MSPDPQHPGPEEEQFVPEDDVAFSGVRMGSDHEIGVVFHGWLVLHEQRVGLVEAVFAARPLERLLGHTAELGETGET